MWISIWTPCIRIGVLSFSLLEVPPRAEKCVPVQKSQKPSPGTGLRSKNWDPIGKVTPENGVNRQNAASRRGATEHASVEHAQQRREVGTLWACKCGTRAAEKRGRSGLRPGAKRMQVWNTRSNCETIERMRLPPGDARFEAVPNDVSFAVVCVGWFCIS